jgi:hypothetical protein
LDISSDLSSVGAPKADHSAYVETVDEGGVVQDVSPRRESQDPCLPVVPPVVNPNQRGVPVELGSQGQGHAVLVEVELVFLGVKLESNALV